MSTQGFTTQTLLFFSYLMSPCVPIHTLLPTPQLDTIAVLKFAVGLLILGPRTLLCVCL